LWIEKGDRYIIRCEKEPKERVSEAIEVYEKYMLELDKGNKGEKEYLKGTKEVRYI
jgi:hypothetical protein